MNRIKKKNIIEIENEEDDYIINNDEEIEDFQNSNQGYNTNNNIKNKSYGKDISNPKEQNKNKSNKNQKISNRSGGGWIKENKAKFQQEKNNNINKTDSRMSNNIKNNNKKIINFDEMPVGGGMGGGANFNIEIRVPSKKPQYIDKNIKSEDNLGNDKDIYLKKKLQEKNDIRTNTKKANNNYENNDNNNEQNEMERKNSLVSMVTQTCDLEMVGRSEFIGIPENQNSLNKNNSREINLEGNIRLNSGNKPIYSIYDNNNILIGKKSTNFRDNLDNSNFSSINKITDFSTANNLRERTENAIQLQNIQRELDNEIEMNKRLQGQIENYKEEFNNLREELVKKSDTINELQQKISNLEKDLFLQGNQLIEAESKPSQEHYDDIINNYEEMKKNFDKAIERIKSLSDENAELKEKNMRLEEHNKKLKKELKISREKLIYQNNNKNKAKNNNDFSQNNEKEYDNEYENEFDNENNDYNENNNEDINDNTYYNNNEIQNKKTNKNKRNPINNKNLDKIKNRNTINEKIVENINNEEKKEIEETKEVKVIKEKRSIIPEDNDIFGTRNYGNNKNLQKSRKIQEDGIPVIKRMEEKDNVKDIMVNNYATNDDDYYNRPPVGKPKARRIKRNITDSHNLNKNNNNNFNTYEKSKTKIKNIPEVIKNNNYYIDNEINDNINEEDNINNNYKNINNYSTYSNNKEKINKRNTIGGITTSVGVFPSQLKSIANEREILNLESSLFNLQKERDLINDEYLKFPEYPKKREEINAKRKVEIKLDEMNKEISSLKLKIRELKDNK